ncbi:hypothetical protein AKO1_001350 [Acrasis kona]|uniref:Orc1-like AAA ATPase domain-containing protein n=1 Tax=Acrasis kona TaxID=1008807 RepID=A0AAW2ZEA9_9EUKA
MRMHEQLDDDVDGESKKPLLNISKKLYGRENETTSIMETLERVTTGNLQSALITINGYSGIGKTTLIKNIQQQYHTPGHFIVGKYDQFKRDVPFHPLIQAFRELIVTVVKNSMINVFKEQLEKLLSINAQIMIDVIPELEMIIGPQEPTLHVSPQESVIRFKKTFRDFVSAFAQPSHPLIIFLDDVQWVDQSTLSLMSDLMLCENLVIMLAYRTNEVVKDHPLLDVLTQIEKKHFTQSIALEPLSVYDLVNLVSDSLQSESGTVEPNLDCQDYEFKVKYDSDQHTLASILSRKTMGNPLFVSMLLSDLCNDDLIRYNSINNKWEWSSDDINERRISDGVVEMIQFRFYKLSLESQHALSTAACIGSVFDVELLEHVEPRGGLLLSPLVKEGFIVVTDNSSTSEMQFLHDKVHQVAYGLVDMNERQKIKLKIAQTLLDTTPATELDNIIFVIMNHFICAFDLIKTTLELYSTAKLALRAGLCAKSKTAYFISSQYFQFGIDLMTRIGQDVMWSVNFYSSTFDLYLNLCEVLYLSKQFDQVNKIYPYLIQQCNNEVDSAYVYVIQSCQHELLQDYTTSVSITTNSLKKLGIDFPEINDCEGIKNKLDQETRQLDVDQLNLLLEYPETTCPRHIVVMQTLMSIWSAAACLGNPEMTSLCCCMIINYSIRHGVCDYTGPGLALFSYTAGQVTGSYKNAYLLGKAGYDLINKSPTKTSSIPKVCIGFSAGPQLFGEPISKSVACMKLGLETSLKCGNIPYATYLAHHIVTDMFFSGEHLTNVKEQYDNCMCFLEQNNPFIYIYAQQCVRPIVSLWTPCAPSDTNDTCFKNLHLSPLHRLINQYAQVVEAFYFEKTEQWILISDECETELSLLLIGGCKVAEVAFCRAMIYLGHDYPHDFDPSHKQQCLSRADAFIKQYTEWSLSCEENFSYKLQLLLGEKARISGNEVQAHAHFKTALSLSEKYKMKHYEGMSYELLGKLSLRLNKTEDALFYLNCAAVTYSDWGAEGKRNWLSTKYKLAAQ